MNIDQTSDRSKYRPLLFLLGIGGLGLLTSADSLWPPAGPPPTSAASSPCCSTDVHPPARRRHRPPTDHALLHGFDVSHHQESIDWGAAAADGYAFVFIKCSQGTTFIDPSFATHWTEAGREGLARGAYHFFDPTDDPVAQATHLAHCMGGRRGELPPAIDIETFSDAYVDRSCDQLIASIGSLLEQVHRTTGRRPVVYTNPSTWRNQLCGTDAFDDYPLWLASYSEDIQMPPGWDRWAFWQRTPTLVPGLASQALDLDVFHGDRVDLEELGRAD